MTSKFPEIKPCNEREKQIFTKNPRLFIEAKLEQLRQVHPLVNAVHESIVKNNLTDTEFYLFLAYYSVARLVELENKIIHQSNINSNTRKIKRTSLSERSLSEM